MRIVRVGVLAAMTAGLGVLPVTAGEWSVPKELQGYKPRLVGPPAGGRVTRVSGVAGDPLTFFAATASGGVWRSLDGGAVWKSVFDDQPDASIGALAVAPSDPNVVYVGAGEANIRGNVAVGHGIYRSTDRGTTWRRVWEQEGQIGTIVVHPGNPDVAFAAVLGHAFGPNPERGVYRTRDGGATWERVLFKDADTGASDVALDPTNPRIVFAGLWQTRRRPWEMTSGGPGSGLWKSSDGGESWTELTAKGLPAKPWGKVGVAVAPSLPQRIYALIEAEAGGLYRSDDGGTTWELANDHRSLRQRAWYYSTLTVDPQNADVVWFPQVPMLRTIDGGRTIHSVPGFRHGDHHDLWIDPREPRRMIVGNDGGVELSIDGGTSWRAPDLPISQFYRIAASAEPPYQVAGTMQDLGTAMGPLLELSGESIPLSAWRGVGGGEAGDIAIDPSDPEVVWAGEYGGALTRFDGRTGLAENVTVYPTNPSGHGAADLRHRFQWTAPVLLSPHDSRFVCHAAEVIFCTADGGLTWKAISPDLTRNDKSKQQWSGGPITGDNTGVEIYGTVFALAESPRQRGLLWAGTDDGLVHLSRDGGARWENLSARLPALPEWGTVRAIEASPHDAGTAWVVVDAHRLDDMRPHLWRTTDFGATWTSQSAGLPQNAPLYTVREDPRQRGLLFLGGERGVAFSRDGGESWKPLGGLPTVAVADLEIRGDTLIIGTHGRSIWAFDDLGPVRQLTPAVAAKPLHLFTPSPAVRWRRGRSWGSYGAHGAGENPPEGAAISYWLAKEAKEEAKLEVFDTEGHLVRTLSSLPEPVEYAPDDPDEPTPKPKGALETTAGLQRAIWDLRLEGCETIPEAKLDSGDLAVGPLVPPGRYRLRLTVEGQSSEALLEVRRDPRERGSDEAAAARFAVALELRDEINRLVRAVDTVRAIHDQSETFAVDWEGLEKAIDLLPRLAAIGKRCDELEAALHNSEAEVVYDILARRGGAKLYSLYGLLYDLATSSDAPPTQGLRDVHAELRAELERLEREVAALLAGPVAELNAEVAKRGIPHLVPPAVGP